MHKELSKSVDTKHSQSIKKWCIFLRNTTKFDKFEHFSF